MRRVGARAVLGADIEAAADGEGLDDAVDLPTTEIGGDVEADVREVDRKVRLRDVGEAMRELDVSVGSRLGLIRIADLLPEEVDRDPEAFVVEAPRQLKRVLHSLASDVTKRPAERSL